MARRAALWRMMSGYLLVNSLLSHVVEYEAGLLLEGVPSCSSVPCGPDRPQGIYWARWERRWWSERSSSPAPRGGARELAWYYARAGRMPTEAGAAGTDSSQEALGELDRVALKAIIQATVKERLGE